MIREETASSDYISDYSEENQNATSFKAKPLSYSFKFTLFMCLLQGFSEKLFVNMLLFGYIWRYSADYLNSEWMLFFQHLIGCIGFLFWSLVCNYLKPQIVLSISFIVCGLISISQSFSSSYFTLLLFRYLLSFSYGALEPSVQVISANYKLNSPDTAKLFGAVSCYKSFGSFISIAISTMIYLKGNDEVIATYSRTIWIVTGGVLILISLILFVSIYKDFRSSNKNSVLEMVLQDNYYYKQLENYVSNNSEESKDKVTIICIYFVIFLVGLFTNIVSEIYSFYQITSSFSFERYEDLELNGNRSGTYLLSLNLTYYALNSVVFLLGSAIGSLLFGILYRNLYGITKKIKEKLEISSIATLGRMSSISILCLTSTSVITFFMLNLLLIHFLFEIPNISKFSIIDIVANSFNFYWIIPQMIAVFFMGLFLTILVEVIPRFQILNLNQFSTSTVSYGFYLMITGIFSDPSLYKYIHLFTPDKNYTVSIEGNSSFNIIPSIFHNPIKKLFSSQLINKLGKMGFPTNYIYYQELQMSSSIYSILFYSLISFIILILLLIKLIFCKRSSKRIYLTKLQN
ncbi:multi-pass transmembrane [Cryptosporidium sp. chipmunk genotype I]|uniref:multi-pass transmembrane n=1 Tax=Cryptosporidium sp. chipmunk genotype I TaxID=1280935 RepID=UPI00351A97D8|nr:multi-pass transmembrane [Cryptosporidium sp. chipmunk genotype I]